MGTIGTRTSPRSLGPERFYYDKSTYTGHHRFLGKFGGPSLPFAGEDKDLKDMDSGVITEGVVMPYSTLAAMANADLTLSKARRVDLFGRKINGPAVEKKATRESVVLAAVRAIEIPNAALTAMISDKESKETSR